MNEYSKAIEIFLRILRASEENNRISREQIAYEDKLLQDILHKIELDNLNYNERAKLATELKNSRKNRRIAKDTVEITEPILNWIDENKRVVEQLKQLLGKTRKIEESHVGRKYTPKVRKK